MGRLSARRGHDAHDESIRPTRIAFEPRGLGYVARFPEAGAEMMLDHLVQARGNLYGELTVERLDTEVYDGALLQASFNVSNFGDRERAARYLGDRSNGFDWTEALEIFCTKVLRAERTGQPFEEAGNLPPAEQVRFLLDPLLPEGRPTIIFGEGGVGKSTLAAAIVVSVATGIPALEGWTVKDGPQSVLVLDWEADRGEWNDRVAAVARGMGIEPPTFHYRQCVATLPDQLHEIAQHQAQHGTALAVVDSVGLAMPARTEGSDANDGALRLFTALRHLSLTSVLIDHVAGVNMGAQNAVVKPYGSVYKVNLARQVFELRTARQTDDGVMHLGLFHRKANATARNHARGIAISHAPGTIRLEGEELEMGPDNGAIDLGTRIVTTLLSGGKTVKAIAAAVGSTEETVREYLGRLAAMGRVTVVPEKHGRAKVWGAVAGFTADEPQHQPKHVAVPTRRGDDDYDVERAKDDDAEGLQGSPDEPPLSVEDFDWMPR